MKIFLTLIAIGLLTAAGGVGYLLVNDMRFPNANIWMAAVSMATTDPGFMLSEALAGPDKVFFRGVGGAIAGAAFTGAIIASAILYLAMGGVWARVRKLLQNSSKKKNAKVDSKETRPRRDRKARKGSDALARAMRDLVGKIATRGKRKRGHEFVDGYADLEALDAGTKKASFFEKCRTFIGGLKKEQAPIVIRGAGEQDVVLAADRTEDFGTELKQWYSQMKAAGKNDPEVAHGARVLVERATERARGHVMQEDALNGEFMLRMLDAWAAKVDEPEPAREAQDVQDFEADGEISVFARAIEEVQVEGIESEEEDGEELDLEAEDDERQFSIAGFFDDEDEDDEGDDDDVASVDTGSSDGDDVAEEEAGVILGDDGGEDDIIRDATDRALEMIGRLIEIERLAEAVSGFEAEWEDDLSDEAGRVAYIEECFDALDGVLEIARDEVIGMSEFDVEDNAKVEWVRLNLSDLDMKKEALLEAVAEFNSGNGSDDMDEDDLDAQFAISGVTKAAEENVEEESETDEVTNQDVGPDEEDSRFDDEGEVTEETQPADMADEGVEAERADPAAEGSVPPKEETEAPAAPPAEGVVDEVEPQDLTISELEEVAMSGDLLYNWGYVARAAGASEAKISHSVLAKDGLRRRVVGIVHLVAGWRLPDSDESRRLNIIMRHLPEGEWQLVVDDGIRMVDAKGNFVQVSPELMRQPEISGGTLVVHFYGPGAPEGMLVEEGNVVVTTSTMGMDALKRKMTA